jgi:hypothetical protein
MTTWTGEELAKKYQRYAASIIDSVVSPHARAAALRLVPHS